MERPLGELARALPFDDAQVDAGLPHDALEALRQPVLSARPRGLATGYGRIRIETPALAATVRTAPETVAVSPAVVPILWPANDAPTARSQLRLTIEDVLDNGLPRTFDKPLCEQKCGALFEHVFENYHGEGAGTFATAA